MTKKYFLSRGNSLQCHKQYENDLRILYSHFTVTSLSHLKTLEDSINHMPNFLVQRYSSVLSCSKLLRHLLVWFGKSKWFAHLVSVGTANIFWSAHIELAPDIPVRNRMHLHAVCTLPNTIFFHHFDTR